MGNLTALTHGAHLIYPHSHFDAFKTLKAIETYKASSIYGVPTMFIEMIKIL